MLFESTDAFIKSGFLFRIVDNGGETYDRITVTTCDGDAALCSTYGVCTWNERTDVQIDADAVQAGTARDLRWIDLDPSLQRSIVSSLNDGLEDWLADAPAEPSRDAAIDWDGLWTNIIADKGEPSAIYRDGDGYFRIREYESSDEHAPFQTFADAVRYALPQDYDLSGPEYHSTVDLADEEGGAKPYWDRSEEPPVMDEGSDFARVSISLERPDIKPGEQLERIGWFATVSDAENFLGTSATIDPEMLDAGCYSICDMDDPDAS